MKHLRKFNEQHDSDIEQIDYLIKDGDLDEAIEILKFDTDLDLSWDNYSIPINAIRVHYEDLADQFSTAEDALQSKELVEVILKHPGFDLQSFVKHGFDEYENNPKEWNAFLSTIRGVDPDSKNVIDMQNRFDIL